MRILLFAACLGLSGCGPAEQKPAPEVEPPAPANPTGYRADPDMAVLAGLWRVTAAVSSGKVDPKAGEMKLTYRFAGLSLLEKRGDEPMIPWAYTLDSAASPKRITAKPMPEGKAMNGIYEVDGNRLRLCWNVDGGPHPTAMESKEGSKVDLLTLER